MLCLKLCFAGTTSDSIRYNTSIRDLSSSNRGEIVEPIGVQALRNPNPLQDVEGLVVELSCLS